MRRLNRTPLVRNGELPPEAVPLPDGGDEAWEVNYVFNDDGMLKVFNVQKNRTEIHEKDMRSWRRRMGWRKNGRCC